MLARRSGEAEGEGKNPLLVEDIAFCTAEVRRHDNDRYLSALFAPSHARDSLMALYALNVELSRVSEMVRDPNVGEMRLQWWRDGIHAIYGEQVVTRPVLRALIGTNVVERVPQTLLHQMIDARAHDLYGTPLPDIDALCNYGVATAGSLIEAALYLLDADDHNTVKVGRELGIAWAISGLIRAIPFHVKYHRTYLPKSLMDDVGLDASTLYSGYRGDEMRAAVRQLDAVVGEHLYLVRASAKLVTARAIPAFILSALLDVDRRYLRDSAFDPFSRKLKRRPVRRLARLTYAAWIKRI